MSRLLLAGIIGLALAAGPRDRSALPVAQPNDNRRPAGRLEHDAGALVIDSARASGDERIFVINAWSESPEKRALTINGRSWFTGTDRYSTR